MSRQTKVTCDGSTLTASFNAANPPLIWRFDLERNHSFTLALHGENSEWELGVTSPKGEFYPIVHFAAREDAEEAFTRVECALSRRRMPLGFMVRVLLGFLVGVLAITGGVAGFGYYASHKGQSTPINQAGMQALGANMQEGVPLSADDVLKVPGQ